MIIGVPRFFFRRSAAFLSLAGQIDFMCLFEKVAPLIAPFRVLLSVLMEEPDGVSIDVLQVFIPLEKLPLPFEIRAAPFGIA